MALDNELVKALHMAAFKNDQPKEVATRLEAWMTQVSDGNISLEKPDDYKRLLELTLSAVVTNETESNEENE